jgi:glucose-1-phosphate adenylyltransferase
MHRSTGAEVTCAVRTVPLEEAHRFGILDVDASGRVTDFVEKPPNPTSNLVSMGVYVFSWSSLREVLSQDRVDFGRDVLPWMVREQRGVYAYEFKGYWQDVGTVEAYWRTSLDLLSVDPGIDLNDLGWLVYTKSEERPPAMIGPQGRIERSMVSHGCVIDGHVERSILSPGVRVADGATVRDSIVMFDTVIGAGAVVDRSILDKECRVGAGAVIGEGDDLRPNRDEPERLYAGITLLGKRAHVPARVHIGRNCRIDPGVGSADFGRRRVIRSGETVTSAG